MKGAVPNFNLTDFIHHKIAMTRGHPMQKFEWFLKPGTPSPPKESSLACSLKMLFTLPAELLLNCIFILLNLAKIIRDHKYYREVFGTLCCDLEVHIYWQLVFELWHLLRQSSSTASMRSHYHS